MVGKWFQRVGLSLAGAGVASIVGVLAGLDFSEFGIYAAIAAGAVGLISKVLGDLGRKIQDKLQPTP